MRVIGWNIRAGGGSRAAALADQLGRWAPDVVALCEFRGTPPSAALARALHAQGLRHQAPDRPGAPPRPEAWARALRNIPSGRLGRAEDIAAAVRFFCLPETEFTTGQSLLVDGGHSLYLHE